MKRKLIQLSPSTTVVSIPKEWIVNNNLKKGDEVNLDRMENEIVITTTQPHHEREAVVDLTSLHDRLPWMWMDGLYTSGYDTILCKTKDPKHHAMLNKAVRWFPGLMIDEETPDHVRLKDVSRHSPAELDKMVSRIFNLLVALLQEGKELSRQKSFDELRKLKMRDYTINSYMSYCIRHINKFGATPFSKTGTLHTTLKIIEIMADKICTLFVGVGKEEIRLTKELEAIEHVENMMKAFHILHFGFTKERLIAMEQEREALLKLIPDKDTHTTIYLTEIAELLYDLAELETQLHV